MKPASSPTIRARVETIAVALDLLGDTLPREFRIFKAGTNETRKGVFLFDEKAAAAVMAAYALHVSPGEHGAMIDLEHQSLDPESNSYDPDARGWCRLELRSGELWAVDVHWTNDGSARLREKRQRFISPAFTTDETGRVTEIINIAITALPATDRLLPLVAASKRKERLTMTPEQLGQLAEILGLGKDALVEDILSAVGAMMSKINGSGGAGASAAVETPEPEGDEAPAAMQAARNTILRLTGATTSIEALSTIEKWKESHATLSAEREKLANERKALELTDRVKFVREMVTLGELPANAWAAGEDGLPDGKTPAEPWASMPIDSLRKRVETLRGKGKPTAIKPPAGTVTGQGKAVTLPDGRTIELTAEQVKICADTKCDEVVYATLISRRGSRTRAA